MVATDKPEKDWPTAERAYAIAKKSIPDLELLRVTNLPHDEAMEILRSADIFMLTSKSEGGNSLALMEAMSMGKPCVVSYVGGFIDIVKDGDNGLFAMVGSPEDFAEGIVFLATHPEERERLGRSAKETAAAFSWRRTAKEYEALFQSL